VKYYFITYVWRFAHGSHWEFQNTVLDVFPLDWLVDKIKNDYDFYILINYKEISFEVYQQYKGKM